MKLFVFMTAFLTLSQAGGPSLEVELLSRDTVGLDEPVIMRITVSIPPGEEYSEARLRPLLLDKLETGSISSGVEQVIASGKVSTIRWFLVELNPLSDGQATISDVEVELVSANSGEAQPLVLRGPGFSVMVTKPFRWDEAAPWILAAVLAVAVFVGASMILSRKTRDRQLRKELSVDEKRTRILNDIKGQILRSEWRDAIERSFSRIVMEVAGKDPGGETTERRLSRSALSSLSQEIPEFPAAYRLGEEVRYGGYEPVKREAVYMLDVLRNVYQRSRQLEEESRGNTDEH